MEEYNYASRNKRLANWLIDSLFVGVIFIMLFNSIFKLIIFLGFFSNLKEGESIDLSWIGLIIAFIYYLISEGVFKTTIGKIITRTKIIKMGGGDISFNHAIKRTLLRFIPLEPLSYLSKNPVGWHDDFSNTRIIERKK